MLNHRLKASNILLLLVFFINHISQAQENVNTGALLQQQEIVSVDSAVTHFIVVNDTTDFSLYTKTNASQAFFWSGRTNGIGGPEITYEIAKVRGGQTLENVLAANGVMMPDWSENPNAWIKASMEYTKQASGVVWAVIGEQVRPQSVWLTKELPMLKDNVNVTRIIVIDPQTLEETIIFIREIK